MTKWKSVEPQLAHPRKTSLRRITGFHCKKQAVIPALTRNPFEAAPSVGKTSRSPCLILVDEMENYGPMNLITSDS